jgi:hypothetical protein
MLFAGLSDQSIAAPVEANDRDRRPTAGNFMEERALQSFTKQSLVSHSSYNDRMLRMRHGAVDRVSRDAAAICVCRNASAMK